MMNPPQPAILLLALAATLTACAPRVKVEVIEASYRKQEGFRELPRRGYATATYVGEQVIVTQEDFVSARAIRDGQGRQFVLVTLTPDAGDRLFEHTRRHIKQPLAIYIDGQLAATPIILSPLKQTFAITGGPDGLSKSQVKKITRFMKSHKPKAAPATRTPTDPAPTAPQPSL